ncbi:MAG TPA: glycosyltransferase family 39 protein [Blastocatellia bacterium]|nr:glycosyltransferase family 39 protein [Blastocatellia bacterium]
MRRLRIQFTSFGEGLAGWFSRDALGRERRSRLGRLILTCAIIFGAAIGVRLLHWQDAHVEIERQNTVLTDLVFKLYRSEANRIVQQGRILFPSAPHDQGDARMLVHPPGYSILLAAVCGDSQPGDSYRGIRLFQVICDALCAVLVVLIAAEFFALTVAGISGALVALSPHLAHYSLWLSPDSLAVLPLLVAVYLIVLAVRKQSVFHLIAAGVAVGLSCWLRSNALLLAPFLSALIVLLLRRGKRLKYGLAFVATSVAVISPITIRNWIVYDRFVPLSLGAGITMVEGIADYDCEGRFGMPPLDRDVADKDAEWHGRPDYAANVWVPDGVDRDRARFSRGLRVIRSNPGWFLGVALRRAGFMLSYNDSRSGAWPFTTNLAPAVAAEPPFGHSVSVLPGMEPVSTSDSAHLVADGGVTSPQARVSPGADGASLRVEGDGSDFGDQLASRPFSVNPHTDYLLTVPVEVERGPLAAKVTSDDRRIALAAVILRQAKSGSNKPAKKNRENQEVVDPRVGNEGFVVIPFASGARTEVRLVLANNGPGPEYPIAQVGAASLFELGPTPGLWTRVVRPVVRSVQRATFKTNPMRALIAAGIVLLVLACRRKELLILLAVPVYYLCAQSALHTEYRYVLAIHYFLFVMAAVSIYCAGAAVYHRASRGARWASVRLSARR